MEVKTSQVGHIIKTLHRGDSVAYIGGIQGGDYSPEALVFPPDWGPVPVCGTVDDEVVVCDKASAECRILVRVSGIPNRKVLEVRELRDNCKNGCFC